MTPSTRLAVGLALETLLLVHARDCLCRFVGDRAVAVCLGFVQWIDRIRAARTSNEARQNVFVSLYGEIQRKMGVKVLEMGGNAVVGYRQDFDLEGETGMVARGIGTVVSLVDASAAGLEITTSTISGAAAGRSRFAPSFLRSFACMHATP